MHVLVNVNDGIEYDDMFFEVKLTYEMAGNSIHFWRTNGCFCESVKVFETEYVSTRGGDMDG